MVFEYCFFTARKELPLEEFLGLLAENKVCFVCFHELDKFMLQWSKCYNKPFGVKKEE